ncbi:MAG: class II aldolase/adducin family protein [Acidilobaceae archaeon]
MMKTAYNRGLTQTKGGNASILDRDLKLVYISPRALPKQFISPTTVSLVTLDGKVLWGDPSSELALHLEVYRRVEKARAVLHLHPPYILALAERWLDTDLDVFSETVQSIGCIARVPYIKPATLELAKVVAEAFVKTGCSLVVLEKHGVVAYSSSSLYEALNAIETLEDLSKIIIVKELIKKR